MVKKNTGNLKKACIYSYTISACLSQSTSDEGDCVCGSSRGYRTTLARLVWAILILPHQHWEDAQSVLLFLRNMLQWTPWRSRSPLMRSPSRSYLTHLLLSGIKNRWCYISLLSRRVTSWWSWKAGRNLSKAMFFNSCHQHSVRLSKTKNSPLSQIENLLAAKIH